MCVVKHFELFRRLRNTDFCPRINEITCCRRVFVNFCGFVREGEKSEFPMIEASSVDCSFITERRRACNAVFVEMILSTLVHVCSCDSSDMNINVLT